MIKSYNYIKMLDLIFYGLCSDNQKIYDKILEKNYPNLLKLLYQIKTI